MGNFERIELLINGVRTVILAAGEGPPLMFLHGAGTFTGFDFALPWTKHFKLLIPYHPGFGESSDGGAINGVEDYVSHYLALLERLQLPRINLIGFSMGGWIAASLASQHPERIRKLALVAPAGLQVADYSATDLFRMPSTMMPAALSTMMSYFSVPLGTDFMFRQYREMTSVMRLAIDGTTDPTLSGRLAHLTMPVLLVWGERDMVVPAQHLPAWRKAVPGAIVTTFRQAGHLVLEEAPDAVISIMDFMK